MELKEFTTFFDELAKQRQVPTTFNGKPWLDNCIKVHKELLDVVKENTIEVDSKLEGTKGLPPERVIGPKVDKILEIVPNYIQRYNIQRDDLKLPMLKKPRRIRTAKHIMGYTKRADVCPHKTLELSKIVAEMGEMWEDSKNHCQTQKVVISIDPRSFIHIGCGGLNSGSCWRSGPTAKFAFGSIPGSFCFYIPTEDNDNPCDPKVLWGCDQVKYKEMYHMRGIGWVDFENETVSFSNTYGNTKFTNYTYLSSIMPEIYRNFFPSEKEIHTSGAGCLTNYNSGKVMTYLNGVLVTASTKKDKVGQSAMDKFWTYAPTSQELNALSRN